MWTTYWDLLYTYYILNIPDETGIDHVLYSVSANNQCPPILDLVNEAVSGQWTSDLSNITIIDGTLLEVFVLVSINNEVHTTVQYLQIDQNRVITVEKTKDNLLLENDCEVDAFKLALTTQTCDKNVATISRTSHGVSCVGTLLFEDNFDGDKVDANKWQTILRILLNRKDTEEFVAVTDSKTNLFVENGILHIKPTISYTRITSGQMTLGDKCKPLSESIDCEITTEQGIRVLPVYSAMIDTNKLFTFQHGHIEIRAKLPQGDWLYPYIALETFDVNRNVYHPTQIRIAFARGNQMFTTEANEDIGGTSLYSGMVYWNDNERVVNLSKKVQSVHFGEDFHVYSLKWYKNNTLTMAVDGNTFGVLDNLDANALNAQFYVKLGVSAGGFNEFPDSSKSTKPWENTDPKSFVRFWKKKNEWQRTWNGNEALLVDYVRVYSL